MEQCDVSRTAPSGTIAVPDGDGDTAAASTRATSPPPPPTVARWPLSLEDARTDAYAQVLHDEPLQLLIAAMLHLDGLPGQYRTPAAQRAVDLLERAAEHLRQLVQAMSAPDHRDTLPTVVRRECETLLGGRGIRFEHVGDTALPLTAQRNQAAVAILVAALADRRNRTTTGTVTLGTRIDGSRVVITLHDDLGEPEPTPAHHAAPSVADLRARATEVGGVLDFPPAFGLTLTLPAGPGGPGPGTC